MTHHRHRMNGELDQAIEEVINTDPVKQRIKRLHDKSIEVREIAKKQRTQR